MRTKNKKLAKFIPINNNSVNKAIAFAPTLDVNNIKNVQKIKMKEFYIPTIEVVTKLQDEGWQLTGVNEFRGNNRKIINNFVQMQHPDFSIKNAKGQSEALSSITITNSCSGDKPMQLDLGVYRLVCTNGLVMLDKAAESEKLTHTRINYNNLDSFVARVLDKTSFALNEFEKLKTKNLTVKQMRDFAYQAAQLRFSNDQISNTTINDLLAVNRIEDEGDDLWSVFNRVQETLTANITNPNQDIRLNKQLFNLADQYVLAV
jgi:hypothetical protein